MHKKLFGVEAKKVGGDTGYAETENRDYCKVNGIQTSFVKRGRPFGEKKQEKDLVRKELDRVRATAMEGSFGTQKEHYNLRRVKTRTKRTEILYIFFGIHTANVVQLAVSLGFIFLVPDNVLAHWLYLVGTLVVLCIAYVLFMKKYYYLHEEYLASLKK